MAMVTCCSDGVPDRDVLRCMASIYMRIDARTNASVPISIQATADGNI